MTPAEKYEQDRDNVQPIRKDWIIAWDDIAAIREPKHIDRTIAHALMLNAGDPQDNRLGITRFVLWKALEQGRTAAVLTWMIENNWIGPRT